MNQYYTAIIFLNIFAMIVIQVCISHSGSLTRRRKRLFHLLFSAIIIASFCEWMGNYLQGTGTSTRMLHIILKAMELSIAPSIGFLVAWVIEKRYAKLCWGFLTVHAVLECLSGIYGQIYYVDENSNYLHADFYWIYILAYLLSIGYCIYIVLRNVRKYQYNGIGYFVLVVAFMLSGIVLQMYDSSLKVDYFTLAFASVMLYVLTLEMIYQTDELTELINRRGYENYILHLEDKCIILFFDVDEFKKINDTYGHAYGDEVIRKIGTTLKAHYSRYGKCFRFGGDEFCVILTKYLGKAGEINKEFQKKIKQLRKEDERLPHVSVGYSYFDPESQNIRDCVAEADQMMYLDKAKRKQEQEIQEEG